MKKRVNLINRVSALGLSFFLALGLFAPAFTFEARAEALPEILESSATVADCVMTYYAMSGSAVANTDWINTLYSSLGSSFGTLGDFAENSLMTYVDGVWKPTETLVQNIQSTSAYTNLGLDTVFNVSAEEVTSGGGYVAATGASTLAGAASCVATHGILPVLGGVTAAYWGGIALGTLASHMIEKYAPYIYTGMPISEDLTLPSGYGAVYVGTDKMYTFNNVYGAYYTQDSRNYLYFINPDDFSSYYRWLDRDRVVNAKGLKNFGLVGQNIPVGRVVRFNDYNEILAASQRGDKSNVKSPDLIGEDGNLSGQYENEEYTVPDLKPQIDPQTQAGKPLSLQDWLQFANGVQNNNNSTSPVPENTSLFQDILDAIKGILPSPGPTPDPSPGGETYPVPGPTPDPSPVPDPEYQPETKPQPQYTEKPTENETDITEGDPWTTPDLLDKFPFCIPRDVFRVFTKLDSGARSAPHIQWRFNPNSKIDYTFDIDFSEWDSVATLLRTLELLGFIVALAVATRKMILS